MSFKSWLFIAIGLFGIGMMFGLATPDDGITNLLSEDLEELRQLSAILGPFQVTTAVFIFTKNVSVLLLSFLFSPFLGIIPVLALVGNGWLLSSISVAVVQEESLGFLIAGILPHGIIELPAIIMGEAAALSFGALAIVLLVRQESRAMLVLTAKQDAGHILLSLALFLLIGIFHTVIILALLKEQTRTLVMANLKRNLRYLAVACILLLPAAIIETYITPLFIT